MKAVSRTLRLGILIGLALLIAGLLISYFIHIRFFEKLALWIIVVTPSASLAVLAWKLFSSRDFLHGSLAVLLLILIATSSILLMIK